MTIRRCIICRRPDVRDINHDLADGMSFRRVISKYAGLRLSTLHAHSEHADEYAERQDEALADVDKVASLSNLDTDTPPTQEEYEALVTAIVLELRGWHSISMRIADRLHREGHGRFSPLFVATIPTTSLKQRITERPERRAYIPQEWINSEGNTYHHHTRP